MWRSITNSNTRIANVTGRFGKGAVSGCFAGPCNSAVKARTLAGKIQSKD
jgi:hypothetical protein